MPSPNPGPALLVAFVAERLRALGGAYGLHPQAHRDVARRIANAFTLTEDGDIAARSGEDADSALADKLTTMRGDPSTSLYFLAVANDTPTAPKPAPLHKMSARAKLSHANGVAPLDYL